MGPFHKIRFNRLVYADSATSIKLYPCPSNGGRQLDECFNRSPSSPPPLYSLSTVQCVFVEREQEHYCANREQLLLLVNPPDAGKGLFNASYFGSSPFGALEARAGGGYR